MEEDKKISAEKKLAELEDKKIKHNPFGVVPDEQLKKALQVLEEYSEEINPF
jgi:hypothetical protein